ncbi:MAG: transcription antitermination factor NusB [Leptolyngbyaceae cyanobacterium bins.59]|nr:transcription antitermination factor NusB [Leptolyngbyaceae cyanobacterium bins.59]
MQPRHTARELALLSISQIHPESPVIGDEQFQDLLLSSIRALATEVRDLLENARADLSRGRDRLMSSELRVLDNKGRVDDLQTTRTTLALAMESAQAAIESLDEALKLSRSVQESAARGNRPPLDLEAQERKLLKTVRSRMTEVHKSLETASRELNRGHDTLLDTQTQSEIQGVRELLSSAVESFQMAINHLGSAIDLPEFIHLASQDEVRSYALQIVTTFHDRQQEIDALLMQSLVDWQLDRLARVDRDILRIAVAEIRFLDVPDRIAINEAVELAKRYSSEDGHRFINGVLRRVTNQLGGELASEEE